MYVYARRGGRSDGSELATTGEVALSDGDRVVFHDQSPATWTLGGPVALLLHGLTGSHASPYMARIARLLNRQNVRTVRLDWRGCGTGVALARYPYHSGRSSDVLATLAEIRSRCPGSPISLIGFSLGGNVALKLLGEARQPGETLADVARAMAVCPPIDLYRTVSSLWTGWARLYDRYFCRACIRDVRHRQRLRPDAVVPEGWFARPPRTMYEFDETFTAPVCGFASARDYYARSSACQYLPVIAIPTLVIAAQDDPVIPFGQFADADFSPTTRLLAPRHGGHLGFCPPRGLGWLDRRILDFIAGGQGDSERGA
jgi:predicted alpha/beta-fold hydrolase